MLYTYGSIKEQEYISEVTKRMFCMDSFFIFRKYNHITVKVFNYYCRYKGGSTIYKYQPKYNNINLIE